MKKIYSVIVMFLLCSAALHAQTGIYLTYDDFKSGKLMKADKNKVTFKGSKTKSIVMVIGGKEQAFALDQIYGYLRFGYLFRPVSVTSSVCPQLFLSGDYVSWLNQEFPGGQLVNKYYLSKDLNSPLYYVASIKDIQKLAKQHSEFQELVNCIGKNKDVEGATSDCIMKSPTFKKDTNAAIPQVQ